jgi:putative phage-type endonuclease
MAQQVVCSSSDRTEWLRHRMTGLGASDIAAACGVSPWESPFTLWARKRGLLGEKTETEPMRWGLLLEPVILQEYAERTKRKAKPMGLLLRSDEHPWALATCDGTTSIDGDRWWPLEIKTTSLFAADDWSDGPPEHYMLQMQQQALVREDDIVTTACLIGGNRFVWCDVERDERLIRKIIHHGQDMWRRIVEDDPPDVDGSESTKKTLSILYPQESRNVAIGLDGDFLDVADELEQLKERIKTSIARVNELESRVKAAIGTADRGLLPDGRGWSWRSQNRSAYTVPEQTIRVLRSIKPKE